jgi:hypothetical protein
MRFTGTSMKVFVTNFNNLENGFRDMVAYFLRKGIVPTVLDNQSSYPPLLKFYEEMKNEIDLVNVGYNGNTWVFWQAGFNTEENCADHYITTDGDCPPDPDCPEDLLEKMIAVLDEVPTAVKVSPGIRIDNIPDCYSRKADAIGCQVGLTNELPGTHPDIGDAAHKEIDVAGVKIYRSITDTTMTCWRAGYRGEGRLSTNDWQVEQYRMEAPYLVKHVPWYADSRVVSAEQRFYRSSPKLNGPVFGL